ncbi:MAG TPA: LysR family transcriptional regulator [Kofleriaceae bacterium]|nr:LysR family transcriptional regulator [Kofleriaceae bacterium]
MLNYNHLHYFHVVASEGSVARASERLGVTQPTISEQVRALERAIGVTLFERTASGLRLTDDGRIAYEHTSIMFRQGERMIHALGHQPPTLPRALRIGLSAGVVRSTTASFLSPVFALPGCVTSVRTGEAADLLQDLRGGELDLVLSETEPPEATRRGLAVVVLDRPVLVAVAKPDVEPGTSWENVPFIHYRPSSAFHWDVAAFLEQRGLRPQLVAEADDASLLLEAASQGGFATFVPRAIARDALAQGRLRVLATLEPGQAAVHALYHDAAASELVQRAIEVLTVSSRRSAADKPQGLFCVLWTADAQLAARARELGKEHQLPLAAVDSIELLAGIIASVVPTHLVVDTRRGTLDAELVLGPHRRDVRIVMIDGTESGVAAIQRIARDA